MQNFVYELLHELLNDLKLTILSLAPRYFRRWGGISETSQNWLVAEPNPLVSLPQIRFQL